MAVLDRGWRAVVSGAGVPVVLDRGGSGGWVGVWVGGTA